MNEMVRKIFVERWWIWVFVVFFIFIFQIGREKEVVVPTELKTNPNQVAEHSLKEEKTDALKLVEIEEQLKNNLSKEEKQKEFVQTAEEKQTQQQVELAKKWDLRNGIILSTDKTIDHLTNHFTTYYEPKHSPILHETNSIIYYEFKVDEETNLQATAQAESKLLKSLTVQTENIKEVPKLLEFLLSFISFELSNEARLSLVEKMEKGTIHKIKTEQGMVYQWTISEESAILTVMKEKEQTEIKKP